MSNGMRFLILAVAACMAALDAADEEREQKD